MEYISKELIGICRNNRKTYYDADLYEVEREFDLTIEGLTVESSSDKLKKQSDKKLARNLQLARHLFRTR